MTAGALKKDPKTYRRFKRTLFNQTKPDRMRIFEEILFFKAENTTIENNNNNNKQTNKSLILLSPVGFLQKKVGTRLTYFLKH